MKIRKANLSDVEAITLNNIELARESEQLTIDYETVAAGVRAVITDSTKGFYLVFDENNKVVGQLLITFEWSDWKNKAIWWIQSVYVTPSQRRKGIFTSLFRYVKDLAQKKNISALRLYVHNNNTEAIDVYENIKMTKKSYTIYEFMIN